MPQQLSGMKRSMPCEDLSSMILLPTTALSTPPPTSTQKVPISPVKYYDSDDASATSCMDLSALLKMNIRMLGSYTDTYQDDTFIDDVWDFQRFDDADNAVSTAKRQRRNDDSDCNTITSATMALAYLLAEEDLPVLTSNHKLVDLHEHQIRPIEASFQKPSMCLIPKLDDHRNMSLSRIAGGTMV
jgi:hypothetical protein